MKVFIFAPVIEKRLESINQTLNKLLEFLEKDQTEDAELTRLTSELHKSSDALESALQNQPQQPTTEENK